MITHYVVRVLERVCKLTNTEYLPDWMVQHVVDAVLAIRRPKESIDLHMVEIMEMQHKTDMDTS